MKIKEILKKNWIHIVLGLVIIGILFGLFFENYVILDEPVNIAKKWLKNNDFYNVDCGIREELLKDYDLEYYALTCPSVSNAKFVFTHMPCGRCPGISCISEKMPIIIFTNEQKILEVYEPPNTQVIPMGGTSNPIDPVYCVG